MAYRCFNVRASVFPETVEPVRGELGVPDRMLNVFVSQVVLDRPGVVAVIGKLEPASMAQHVRMDRKPDTRPFTGPSDDLTND